MSTLHFVPAQNGTFTLALKLKTAHKIHDMTKKDKKLLIEQYFVIFENLCLVRLNTV